MGLIPLDHVKEGSLLETDISENGQILIKAGIALTERHLRLCRSWGIAELAIQGLDPDKIENDFFANLDPALVTEVQEHCVEVFRHTELNHPAIGALYQIYLKRKLRERHRG